MKRDMDLMRNLLLAIEATDTIPQAESIPAKPEDVVGHVGILIEAGYLGGVSVTRHLGGVQGVLLEPWPRLTWAGHEFLDAARDEGVWQDAKQQAGKVGGAVAIAVMVELLKDAAMRRLGLRGH